MHEAAYLALAALICLLSTAFAAPPAQGGVAADHPLATEAGLEILAEGGNAIDAAVATSLVLSVVRPESCGIGGWGFMIVHLHDHPEHGTRDIAIDYRETCPAGVGPGYYEQWNDPDMSRFGGRAVAVPGTVAGLLHALDRYGTMPLEEVCAPAIRLAEAGYPADKHHAYEARDVARDFATRPGWEDRFAFTWQRLMRGGRLELGDELRLPEQGDAIRLIAEHGRDGFYRGPVAQAIVDAVQADGGALTLEDLATYEVREREPIRVRWRDRTILTMPPPSSGGVAIGQVLALVDRLAVDLPADGWPEPRDAHLLTEAFKHAFADRARHVADPAFADVPVVEMLSPSNLDRMAAMISDDRTFPPSAYGTSPPPPDDSGTSHVCVIDSAGNAVAVTETINLAYGSLLPVPEYGFCLNNEMDDFTTLSGEPNAFGLRQSDANLPEPGKRPLSSMSPTVVLDADGDVETIAGASGGPRIITATAQALLRVLLADSTAEQAVNSPRLHHQWLPDRIRLEQRTGTAPPPALADALKAKGHELEMHANVGVVQLIRRKDGRWQSAADPRKSDQ